MHADSRILPVLGFVANCDADLGLGRLAGDPDHVLFLPMEDHTILIQRLRLLSSGTLLPYISRKVPGKDAMTHPTDHKQDSMTSLSSNYCASVPPTSHRQTVNCCMHHPRYFIKCLRSTRASGSVVAEAKLYNPEGRGLETRWGN
jgi:hypothetical protein